ncbi:F-box/kelch-repeat protein-like [Dorcoceras hygrometricum]|uniref:F-box/kelch-repeat protein-like n=1 Tax=Dorcoceras hygrometricum TaxID=472368 RepID=A0A2Z7D4N5_9LAMI|nr:F-box/kelch-repeat protein-like [Dorcoceras hygrometricum]
MTCERNHQLIPCLPEDIALECLARLHFSAHRVSSQVCKGWRELIQSKDFYYHRKKYGFTHKVACLVQALPAESGSKPANQPRYAISLFDPLTRSWDRLDQVPKYPDGLPMFCQITSTEGKIVVMGGLDPSSWEPVKDVFMYDFTTLEWTKCADMPSVRSFFAAAGVDGKVIIAGGHDASKNALNSAWIFDIKRNEWSELPRMKEERDECEGIVIGSEFWVVSGYDTESQGNFKSSAEVYDVRGGGEWRVVEDAWRVRECPRSCVGFRGNTKELIRWGANDQAVRVGSFGVDLGKWSLLTGSAYQGAPHIFYLVDDKNKININIIPDETYSGFVQSGCAVEI